MSFSTKQSDANATSATDEKRSVKVKREPGPSQEANKRSSDVEPSASKIEEVQSSRKVKNEDDDMEIDGNSSRDSPSSHLGKRSSSETTDSDDEPPTKKRRRQSSKKLVGKKHKDVNEKHTLAADGTKNKKTSDSDERDSRRQRSTKNKTEPQGQNAGKSPRRQKKGKSPVPTKNGTKNNDEQDVGRSSASETEELESDTGDEKPEVVAKAREKVQTTIKSGGKDPYPDWPKGDPVPYAALCTTFSKVEMTTKRLEILAHCSLFLRQVLRLTPNDLLPTILLMINKLAADYAGIELGIGESLIMKAIGESTGRSLNVIKADQNEIGDLGLVAAKSKSNQKLMFKPKPLTVRGVHEGLLAIATIEGQGAQGRKVAGIKKLLSSADVNLAGQGSKGVDITKDKGGPSEAKYIVRTLEGKLRLGLADRTVLVALAQAIVFHEAFLKGDTVPSSTQIAEGESILKSVYRFVVLLCDVVCSRG